MLLLLLLFLFAWTPVRAVFPNHDVLVFQPPTGTAPDLGSVALIITTYSSHHPPHLFRPFLDNSFFFRTRLPSLPQLPPVDAALLSSCTCFSPPTLPGAEWPSTCTAPPPASLHRLSTLPSLSGWPQVVPRASLWLPSLIWFPPPVLFLTYAQVPVNPRVSPVWGSLLTSAWICRSYVCSPPASLEWRPSPLPVLKGFRSVLLSPVPCASASPSPCSAPYLGVFWRLIYLQVSFCVSVRGQGASTP